MDVLKPQLFWIGNRCYRTNINHNNFQEKNTIEENLKKNDGVGGYKEDDLYNDDEQDDFELIEQNGRWKTSFHVPHVFFSQIIGSKGFTKKRIEAETKTQILVPKQGLEGEIIISGQTRQSVTSSRRKVNLIVLAARNRHQFTHFVSIPLVCSEIKNSFKAFKGDILNYNYPTIKENLFQNSDKLHLTICTLTLMDNEDRALAAQTLVELQDDLSELYEQNSRNIDLKLEDVEIMNDDLSATDVLYATVKNETVQRIADMILEKFVSKGLTQKKTDRIKLHCTLLNSLFVDEKSGKRKTFDARPIIENYSKFYFGVQKFTEIHLSQRYSTACDGFYEATGILKF